MKKGTSGHPKVADLARLLKVEHPHALGLLQLLWDFTEDYAPRGDVGRFQDGTIAENVKWRKSPEALVSALIASKWVDKDDTHRLLIHDWPQHCESIVHNRLARARDKFADGTLPNLTRLGKDEKAHAERFYGTSSAHAERTPSARQTLSRAPIPEPEPEPVLEPSGACASNARKPAFPSLPKPPEPEAPAIRMPRANQNGKPQPPRNEHATADWVGKLYALSRNPRDRMLAESAISDRISSGKIGPNGTPYTVVESRWKAINESENWTWKNGAKAQTLAQWITDGNYEIPTPDENREPEIRPLTPEEIRAESDREIAEWMRLQEAHKRRQPIAIAKSAS